MEENITAAPASTGAAAASGAVSGAHTVDGRPRGRTSLTPHIVVSPAAAALDFYAEVFGARVEGVTRFGDAVAHAELEFASGALTLSDPIEAYGLVAPDPERVVYSLALYVPDADAVFARAVESGAVVREPLADFVSGDRFASVVDPFGVRWTLMTRVEDISPQESRRRVEEWAATQQ